MNAHKSKSKTECPQCRTAFAVSGKLFECLNGFEIFSEDRTVVLNAIQRVRKTLSRESPPLDEILAEPTALPIFLSLLNKDEWPEVQFEAAWVFTNIASGNHNHTKAVVDSGAVPVLIRLLEAGNTDIKIQSTWALGNIAGDGELYRNELLGMSVLTKLIANIQTNDFGNKRAEVLDQTSWTISQLLRGTRGNMPNLSYSKEAMPAIKILLAEDKESILENACWALSYASDGSNERVEVVVCADVISRLIEIMKRKQLQTIRPCVRVLGNVLSSTEEHTQTALDNQVLPGLLEIIEICDSKTRKEIMWAFSNVAAGTAPQIQELIDSSALATVVKYAQIEDNDEIQKEILWTLSNMTSAATSEQLRLLVSNGGLAALCKSLQTNKLQSRMVNVVLEGITKILSCSDESLAKIAKETVKEHLSGQLVLQLVSRHSSDQKISSLLQILQDPISMNDLNGHTSIIPNPEIVSMLVAMGYSENACARAAVATGNTSAEDAVFWLFEHQDDADINDSLESPSLEATAHVSEYQVPNETCLDARNIDILIAQDAVQVTTVSSLQESSIPSVVPPIEFTAGPKISVPFIPSFQFSAPTATTAFPNTGVGCGSSVFNTGRSTFASSAVWSTAPIAFVGGSGNTRLAGQ